MSRTSGSIPFLHSMSTRRVYKTYLISDCLMGLLVCYILRQVCTMTKFCRHRCHVHCYNAVIACIALLPVYCSFFLSFSHFNHLEKNKHLSRQTNILVRFHMALVTNIWFWKLVSKMENQICWPYQLLALVMLKFMDWPIDFVVI